ncbi:MAG: N-6 DNA methylase, partial [Treponema sp.]|nr:N-6 DNA methylase [Treponema sp.]
KYSKSTEDYLGRFYGEFMRYSGGSGQSLGIVLTPRHITELFCDLLELKSTDRVFDPCCGTGGFLVAALHTMLLKTNNESEKLNIRKNQLFGIELRPDMFTVATTNMILRGDGKSNLHCDDFLMKNPKQLQTDFRATVGMLNPPYSQGSKQDSSLYEIAFTEHLLDSLLPNSRCAVIVPQSSMTGKTNEEQQIKESILKNHTLEGVIMLQKDTFYGIGVIPCIAVFTSGQPHPKDKICKFINFEDDGFKVSPHVGLLETEAAKDKKQHLLDVWFDRIEAENKFCVKTTVNAQDEWLHSFFYFNDEIPTDADFEKTVGDYLSFEFSMIMQGRRYLFENVDSEKADNVKKNFKLSDREWKEFRIGDLFEVTGSVTTKPQNLIENGFIPRITCSATNNALDDFYQNKATEKGGVLTVDSATIGYVSYQSHDFIATDHVEKITNKDNSYISRFIGLFEKQCIDKATISKYGYGYKFAQERIKNQKILFPVLENGEPDFDFMENYIHELEQEKLSEYKAYALKLVSI